MRGVVVGGVPSLWNPDPHPFWARVRPVTQDLGHGHGSEQLGFLDTEEVAMQRP